MKILTLTLLLSLFYSNISAQILINEYSFSNINGPIDGFGDNEDWVEFYNTTGSSIDLTGYFLSDKSSNLTRWPIPSGSISANGYLKVYYSGRSTVDGTDLHPDFGVTQTKGEWVILTEPGGNVVDSLKVIMVTQMDHSYGRTTDGAANWSLFVNPTIGTANTTPQNYYTTTPNLSVDGGFYGAAQNVTITSTDPLATIYYTIDGSVPTTGSTVYAGPVAIATTTVLRVRSFSSDANTPASFVVTNTYFIGVTHTIPTVSICGNQVMDFINDIAPGSFSSNFDGAIELFESDGTLADEGMGYYNKHGNDSWAYDQRGIDFVMKDQYGYNYAVKHKIFTNKERKKFQKIMLKPAANDNVSFENGAHIRDAYVHTLSQIGELRMDERTNRSCVMYVNGQYWGVYEIREKVDDSDFTKYYYNQPGDQVDFIKTWGSTWTEYGDQNHWTELVTYINANDMTNDVNYQWVNERLNTGSLIDYAVLNSYIVSSDWLVWNTAWWHGHVPEPEGDKQKFRYALWDMDATFGHYINYTGVPSTDPDADPCNVEGLSGNTSADPEGHMTILNKLMENAEFEQQYISRYIDLSNGIFSCESMNYVLDSMIADIAPEMPAQVATWGSSMAQWEANVITLKDYIDARCAALSTGLIDCYDLSGPYEIVVNVDPIGGGQVKVNSEWVPFYPWSSTQYGGINTLFKAEANSNYVFDHWSAGNHTFTYQDSLNDTLDFTSNDTIVAHFIYQADPDDPDAPLIDPTGVTGVHIPNAFSPNNDGLNDMLEYYIGYDVLEFDLIIIDRWGNTVFRTNSPSEYWDGRYKSKYVNSGIYTYVIGYTLTTNEQLKKSGNITLIR
jgi:gliding motility-associated-like protein